MGVAKPRIVILGKTGAGKSSLGNTIFGGKPFKVGSGFDSKTSFCEAKTGSFNGREITLIDTPGFFDTKRSEEDLQPEIVTCITECSPGPHAFLIVLKVERITDHEKEIIQKICQLFSEEVFKFTTVVFTHGDELDEDQKIEDFVNNEFVSDLVNKCGGRCHVIDNKYWNDRPKDEYRSNQYQVEELLKSVEETVKANQGKCYTNENLQAVEEFIQQEAQSITKSSGNMSEEEIREKAKGRVYRFLTTATAITTGALIGALFGVATVAGVVISVSSEITSVAIAAAKQTIESRTEENAIALIAKLAAETTAAETATGTATGTAAGTAGGTAAETAAAGTAGVGTVAGTVLCTAAAVGAVCGGVKGYYEAAEAESPWEAAQKASAAVWSSGMNAIEKSQNLASALTKQVLKPVDTRSKMEDPNVYIKLNFKSHT